MGRLPVQLHCPGCTVAATAAMVIAIATLPSASAPTGTPPTPPASDAAVAHLDAATPEDLASARTRAFAEPDPAARLAALEALVEVRDDLLRRFPDDPRRGRWHADAAEDLLLGVLPALGLDLTIPFGWPIAAEIDRARELVAAARGQLERARGEIGVARTRLEHAAETDARAERLLRELSRDELEGRVPALEGIALGLEVALAPDDPRTAEASRRAVALLQPALIELDAAPRRIAQAHLALALAALGRGPEAQSVARSLAADLDPSLADRLRTALVNVEVARRLDGPRAALDRLERTDWQAIEGSRRPAPGWRDPFTALLVAEWRARLRWTVDDRDALAGHTTLLESFAPPHRDPLRRHVLDRLAERFPPGAAAPRSNLVTVARADRTGDIAALESILRDDTAAAVERMAAGIALVERFDRDGNEFHAARVRTLVARLLPGEPEAVETIGHAATGALRVWLARRDAESAALFDEALEARLGRYAALPGTERWRHESARLAFALDDEDRLRGVLDALPVDSPWRGETLSLLLLLRERDARRAEPTDPAEALRIWREILDRSTDALALMEAHGSDAGSSGNGDADRRPGSDAFTAARSARTLGAIAVLRADALLGLGRPADALAETERLLDPRTESRGADVAELARVRIAALLAADRHDAALSEIDRLVADDDASAVRALSAIARSLRTDLDRRRRDLRDDDADRLATGTLRPVAEALDRLLATPRDGEATTRTPDTESLHWLVAESLRQSGRPDRALHWLDTLVTRRPDALEYLLSRGLTLAALGPERHAEAMSTLRRVSTARASVRDDAFWQAEIAMLRILLATGDHTGERAGGRAAQVRPRIAQLRLHDPELGGPRWRHELDRIAAQAP